MKDVRYFAIPDPDDDTRMTYWREAKGKTSAWPNAAQYGPILWKRDVPKGLSPLDRVGYIQRWHLEVRGAWLAKIRAAIDANRDEGTARFAALKLRCGFCGKALTDPKSKTIGIGPDCRDGFPDSRIATFIEAVGRAHAARLTAERTDQPSISPGAVQPVRRSSATTDRNGTSTARELSHPESRIRRRKGSPQ